MLYIAILNMTDIAIRLEQPADYRETEEMVREAFWNLYSPGCSEHYLLHVMRNSPGFVHELDFVACSEGRIVGSAVFMESYILGDDGARHGVLTMGPLAVLPSMQRKGIGRMLTGHARTAAAEKGFRAIILCGDPGYYRKIGFTEAERYGIRTSGNKYFAALHVCPLREDAMTGLSGRYFENGIYSVDDAEAAAFDRQFTSRELIAGTPSQKRFEEVLAMQKDYPGTSPDL